MAETLSARHKAFVDAYLTNGRNATQAYKSISPDCTDKTAGVEGFKYLEKPKIAAYLAEKEAELAETAGITKKYLIDRLERIALMCEDIESGAFDPKAAIAAVSQMSKMLGLEAPKVSKVELEDKRQVSSAIQEIKDALNKTKDIA
jgi:phage terminase small subunit